ncbi:MAG: glycosyltransferase, partial [Mycobacteriales bacterium]
IDILTLAANRPGAGLVSGAPISVVSPVLNEITVLDRLIPPIAAALGPADEYLLVDSGSTDGTREAIASWTDRDPRIQLLAIESGTIARSRNAGIAAARHDFIACTDAGCRPDEGWLDGMRAAAAHHRTAAARGIEKPPELFIGVYRAAVRRGRVFEQAMAAVSWPDPIELRRPTIGRAIYGRLLGRQFSPNRVDGRSVGFTRRAWEAAGGFPERLRTAEDEAFGRAVRATGAASALTLDAGVTWYQRGRIGTTFSQFRGYGKGGGTSRSPKLLAKDGTRVLAYAAAAIAIIEGGWWGVGAVAVAGLAYLWLPLSRVARRRHWLALPLLPLCAIGKDIAKVLGAAETLLVRPLFCRG